MANHQVHALLVAYFEERLRIAKDSAAQAKAAATDKESVAETKWDTFGLENSYLAHGQSVRVAECEQELKYFQNFEFSLSEIVELGSFMRLVREDGWTRLVIIAQYGGGGEFSWGEDQILIVTPQTPLGKSLLGKEEGDEVLMKSKGESVVGEIEQIFNEGP